MDEAIGTSSGWSARRWPPSPVVLGGLLVGIGGLHLAVPSLFGRLIPRFLGPPGPWVLASGVAELVSGTALLVPRTRPAGAWAAAATLVAVFPGNITMAVDAGAPVTPLAAALWLRLPLQVPLVAWALASRRRRPAGRTASPSGRASGGS